MVNNIGELQEIIATAIENGGLTASHIGPFTTGYLALDTTVSEHYPNQIYRSMVQFMESDERIAETLIPNTDDSIRKLIYILKQHEVIHDETLQEHTQGNLEKDDIVEDDRIPTEFTKSEYLASFTFDELASQQLTRNIYGIADHSKMDWLDEPDKAILNSLLGFQNNEDIPDSLKSFRSSNQPTAGIPKVILAPYRIAWPRSDQ